MYPVVFRIGSFEVTSFGILVGLGVLVGLVVLGRELTRTGLDATRGQEAALIAVVGGLIGAKLLYVLEHVQGPLLENLLARGGLSWFGGLIGGVVAGIAAVVRARLPLLPTLAAAAPALAFGQAVGRIGCFLVGDDYGRPSSLPWAVAFPRGLPPTTVPVHPTQLYEAVGLVIIGGVLLRWRRASWDDRSVVASYLLLAGTLRFGIEFIRINPPALDGLTVAHLVSGVAALLGVGLAASGRRPRAAAGAVARTPGGKP